MATCLYTIYFSNVLLGLYAKDYKEIKENKCLPCLPMSGKNHT